MKHVAIVGLALIPVVFYITALSTDSWMISSGIATNAFSTPQYQANYGIFYSSFVVGAGASYQTSSETGCFGAQMTGTTCDKLKVCEAFTIMALVLVGGALWLCLMNKGMLAASLFAVSGIFGLIGWIVWYAGIQKNSQFSEQLSFVGSTDSGYSIGYSQALDIGAWAVSLLLAPMAYRYVAMQTKMPSVSLL